MPNINIAVAEKIATNTTPGVVIVCGNSDYTVAFDFDAEWAAETNRVARFVYYKDGKSLYQEVEFTGNTVSVPILSGVDYVLVGVYAGNLRTTTPAKVLCDRSILCGDQIKQTTEVSEEEMQGYAEAAAASAQEAAASAQEAAASAASAASAVNDALEAAKESGDFTGPPGEPGPPGDPGEAGYTPVVGEDYFTDDDKDEIVEAVKAAVPLVTTAEQPTFADSVDKMTDTNKVYVMPDGYMWAYMKVGAKTLTADDVVLTNVLPDGALEAGVPRIATKDLLPCGNETISISCPAPYQYFIYFYTDNDISTFIGKTTWVSGDIADVLTATMGSGTSSGAKYCRISLRDGTNSAANLTGRITEFMSCITIKQGTESQYAWTNTRHLYVQQAEKPFYTLQGKNIACFGDSLAANCYVGSGKQWIERVGEFFRCGKIYNRGVGGSAVSSINGSGNERNNYAAFNADGEAYLRISYKTGEAPMEIPEGYTEMKASMELDERVNTIPLDTDILLIEAGTNDNDLDADTLSAAYDRMLVKIQNRIPNAKIVILGLPFVNPKIYSSDDQREYLRNKLDELMGGIREVGKKYGIPVIELKDTAQVNLINYTNYMSNDALHYDTEAGTKRWAETVIKGMFGLMFL